MAAQTYDVGTPLGGERKYRRVRSPLQEMDGVDGSFLTVKVRRLLVHLAHHDMEEALPLLPIQTDFCEYS